MKSKWLLNLLLVFGLNTAFAQNNALQVQGTTPNLFLSHTVKPKENWYSIGRLYNSNPKELAPYNGMVFEKPLSVGQVLKIPLIANNFSQNGSKEADEVLLPVYHTVLEKEWMYRISVNYNKVPIPSLEKWNNITKEQVRAGLNLIVGYLKVKAAQSSFAANKPTSPVSNQVTTAAAKPLNAREIDNNKTSGVIEEKKPEPPLVKQEPVKTNPPKEDNKTFIVNPTPAVDNKGGYFKTQFEEAGKSLTGAAGTFKSTSGWNDGKYYALVNNVSVGTIIKINNPLNGKIVYAKVLGNLPDMKESVGLNARISDAAAAELGLSAAKFSVEMRY